MRRTLGAAIALLALVGSAGLAQSRADSVILRIEGPPAAPATRISGTIRLRDGAEERKYTGVSTPFEIRLPAQALEARFGIPLGGRLSGEMTLLREGKRVGWVSGTSRFGSLRFYRNESGAYGFGSPISWISSPFPLQQRVRLDALMRVLDARGPCVSTAPMPSTRLHSTDSMPLREIDAASVPRMPVARVVPCYLADSIH